MEMKDHREEAILIQMLTKSWNYLWKIFFTMPFG